MDLAGQDGQVDVMHAGAAAVRAADLCSFTRVSDIAGLQHVEGTFDRCAQCAAVGGGPAGEPGHQRSHGGGRRDDGDAFPGPVPRR